MTDEYASNHEHELEAEYLTAADAVVVDVYDEDSSLVLDALIPCPVCSDTLRISARVQAVTEADVEIPLDDSEDIYD